MPWVRLQCVIVVFPDHAHLLIFTIPHINSFTIYNIWFLIAVRQEVKSIDSSVVVHALELAIKRYLWGLV